MKQFPKKSKIKIPFRLSYQFITGEKVFRKFCGSNFIEFTYQLHFKAIEKLLETGGKTKCSFS